MVHVYTLTAVPGLVEIESGVSTARRRGIASAHGVAGSVAVSIIVN